MSAETTGAGEGRARLQLPEDFVLPTVDEVVQDARAILLHTLSLRKELDATGIVLSPIWEGHVGEAAVRAAVVPKEVVTRYYEGPGLGSLRDAGVLEMLCEIAVMLLEQPDEAARVLSTTEELWFHEGSPVRSLEVPFKPHFKLLTLVIADLARKAGAGFGELEWIASLGLLDAFHDPDSDGPREAILASTRDKTQSMCAEEEAWMRALQAEIEG